MNVCEVMLYPSTILKPNMLVSEALALVEQTFHDVLPVVGDNNMYIGGVPKSLLLNHALKAETKIEEVCCQKVTTCPPSFALEHLEHEVGFPYQTVMIVDDDGRFVGSISDVAWATDEAKTQSGIPRNNLAVRTSSMHLTWRCMECGHLERRNDGFVADCPSCGADANAMSLYTED